MIEMNNRVMVLHIENFTKPLYLVVLIDILIFCLCSFIHFTGKWIFQMKNRVMVLNIENFTKPLYEVVLTDILSIVGLLILYYALSNFKTLKVSFINRCHTWTSSNIISNKNAKCWPISSRAENSWWNPEYHK